MTQLEPVHGSEMGRGIFEKDGDDTFVVKTAQSEPPRHTAGKARDDISHKSGNELWMMVRTQSLSIRDLSAKTKPYMYAEAATQLVRRTIIWPQHVLESRRNRREAFDESKHVGNTYIVNQTRREKVLALRI
jgi:hypothetical protein